MRSAENYCLEGLVWESWHERHPNSIGYALAFLDAMENMALIVWWMLYYSSGVSVTVCYITALGCAEIRCLRLECPLLLLLPLTQLT